MDANRLRFWLIANEEHWDLSDARTLRYDRERRSVRLASLRRGVDDPAAEPPWNERPVAQARTRRERVPQALDDYGTRALWADATRTIVTLGAGSYWSTAEGAVVHTNGLPGEVPLLTVPAGADPTDLATGSDGMLYVAIGRRVEVIDLRLPPHERPQSTDAWRSHDVRHAAVNPWRLAPAPDGGVWILDREARKLARLRGRLARELPGQSYDPATFRPSPEHVDPPVIQPLPGTLWSPGDEEAAGLACSPRGRVGILSWKAGAPARMRILEPGSEEPSKAWTLQWAKKPYSIAWLSEQRVAVLLAGVPEAVVYDLSQASKAEPSADVAGSLSPVGDEYPMRAHDGGPFLNGTPRPPHYLGSHGPTPLHPLSKPSFAAEGTATHRVLIDSGDPRTVWHRLYLEADIPRGCAVTVHLSASDRSEAPTDPDEWFPHRFGVDSNPDPRGAPRGAWCSQASEIAHHPGLLQCDCERDRSGLFTVLIQRRGRRVRDLRGRYLWARVELRGNLLTSPEVAALRAYSPRFAYRDHYLPELYREADFGPDRRDSDGRVVDEAATRPDFLGRFVSLFESVLTPLEDKVADAYLITQPASTPPDLLPWLGSWLALPVDGLGPDRSRAMIAHAPELAKGLGTLRGLQLALDIGSGGRVGSRQILVVEDFRLRRTFSTILGIDLADEDDPLLGGLVRSGNSHVGDTLILGDETRKEFLALFSADLELAEDEERAVAALFDRLAHRITILVHRDVPDEELDRVRRIVDDRKPAYVQSRILPASAALIVGLSSLVGVDTYLGPTPERETLRLGDSRIGREDFVQRPPSLDPRVEGDPR